MAAIHGYVKPDTLTDALLILRADHQAHILAGGTDILLQIQKERYCNCTLVDINGVKELNGIRSSADGLWIGAGTKLADIVKSGYLTGALRIIGYAASLIGSPQIRNMATIGGNLCNASPSADLSAPLLVLDAQAEIRSTQGLRKVPLSEFFVGPSKTVIQPGELLSGVHIPMPAPGVVAAYYKHSTRRAMDLAVVGVSALLWRVETRLNARIALSAVAPTSFRVYEAEKFISGAEYMDDKLISEVAALAREACQPISDVRASAGYRKAMVYAYTKKALTDVWTQLTVIGN